MPSDWAYEKAGEVLDDSGVRLDWAEFDKLRAVIAQALEDMAQETEDHLRANPGEWYEPQPPGR